MKGIIYISLLFVFMPGWSMSEDNDGPYRVFSDRSLYMAGESIRYRVYNTSPDLSDPGLSKVFYMELISPDGSSMSRSKNTIYPDGVSGLINIPRDISSGTYYLKGYTRFMRKDGPGNYCYQQLTIINAGSKTVLPIDTSSLVFVQNLVQESLQVSSGPIRADLTGTMQKRSHLSLKLTNQGGGSLNCGVTVIKKGMMERQKRPHPLVEDPGNSALELIPETRGVSLTGLVQFAETGLPAPYALVYISTIGSEKEFLCNYADSDGHFYFALSDGTGEREYFISANHPDNAVLELFVDQDYCIEPVRLPSLPLEIDSSELELIFSMWINTQIADQYNQDETQSDIESNFARDMESELFFYGRPLKIVSFDDYIRLPTLEEYFTELTPEVSIRKSNKEYSLRVHGPHPDLAVYQPLLLVDGVAIFDLESLLSVSPRAVDRFEIVNAPYTRGNVTFGGIINVITKKGDLGAIDLPSSGLLINYMLLSQGQGLVTGKLPDGEKIPDARNTFYWNPGLELSPGESKELEFFTPDQNGDFEVWIRGFVENGQYVEHLISFSVE